VVQVGMVCAALLIVEALIVAVVPLVRARSRRQALLALVPFVAAAGCALLAYHAWMVYQYYATLDVCRSPPLAAVEGLGVMLQRDIGTIQVYGLLVIVGTSWVYAFGGWLLARLTRPIPTGASSSPASPRPVG
jgi:hypothetical protein